MHERGVSVRGRLRVARSEYHLATAALARGERPSAATPHHARSKGGRHGELLQTNVAEAATPPAGAYAEWGWATASR